MSKFPEFPRVFVDSSNIIIEYASGNREIWGQEGDSSKAGHIANELQTSLRAYEYAIIITNESMDEIDNVLRENNCPEKIINEILSTYYQVKFGREKSKKENIKLSGLENKTPEQLLDLAVWYRTREKFFSDRRKQVESILHDRLQNMEASCFD